MDIVVLLGYRNMELERKIKNISDKLAYLAFEIESRAGGKLYDIHIISESFFAELLNIIFGLKLKNINFEEPNAKAIDLIDKEHKLIAQVSSDNSKGKVLESLKKIDRNRYAGYHFLFISISKDVSDLKKIEFDHDGIDFNPNDDCYDRNSLINHIVAKGIDCIEKVCAYLNRTVIATDKKTRKKIFHFSVPEGLLPRDAEVEKLYNGIKNNRFFNLIGVGGSGKSSLTYLMMQKHKEDFNEIAYVVVNDNIGIKESIVSQLNDTLKLKFEKDDDVYKKVVTYLEEHFEAENPNLLVLDVNEVSDEIKDYAKNNSKLCPNKWKILIISREYIDPSENIEKEDLNINQDSDFLKEIFLKRAGERYSSFENLNELFEMIFYNPLLAEQVGFYLSKLPELKTLEEIKVILYGDKFKGKDMKGLAVLTNDNRSTIIDFLINIIPYNSDYFDNNEKELLRHFVLWPVDFINYRVIKELLKGVFESDDDLSETLSMLSDRAILMVQTEEDGSYAYKLHGLLAESLREQGIIHKEDYSKYLGNIDRIVQQGNIWGAMGVCIVISYCIIGKNMRDCNCVQLIQANSNGMLYSFSEVVTYFEQSKEMSVEMPNNKVDYQIMLSNFYIIFSNLYSIDNKKNLAEDCCKKSIEMLEQLSEKYDKVLDGLAYGYNVLASLCSTSEVAIKYNNKAINILEQLPKDNPQYQFHLACAYDIYASLHQDMYNESLEMCTKAINIFENQLQGNSIYQLDLVNKYLRLVMLQRKHCKYDEARTNCEKAIDVAKNNQIEHFFSRFILVCSYSMLAFLLEGEHFHNYSLAKNYYESAFAIGCQLPSNVPVCQFILASTYSDLANLLKNDYYKDYESAKKYYEKAIEIGESLPKDNIEFQNNLAGTYSNIAYLFEFYLDEKIWGNKYELAEVNFNNAINIWKDMPECQNQLASTYRNLAFLQHYNLNDKYELAEVNCNNAISIWKDMPEHKNDLAETYMVLALLTGFNLKDKYESAEENYSNAIKIWNEIPDCNNQLVNAYSSLGTVQFQLKKYNSAKDNYIKAINIGEQLPNKGLLASVYEGYADLLQDSFFDDFELAEKYYKKAIEIEEQLCKDNNNIDFWTWVRYKCKLGTLYFDNDKGNLAKEIIDEIKPLTEKKLAENTDDIWIKLASQEIDILLTLINSA